MQRRPICSLPGFSLFATFLALVIFPWQAAALTPTTTTLATSPNPSIFGVAVTLTATVSPATATGRVTFYDGVNVLGIATLSTGQATLITKLLPSGVRSLKAYYGGDGSFDPSTSAAVAQTVTALPGNGFAAAVNYNAGTSPTGVATGDFNADGNVDVATANNTTADVSVLLGAGNGTFSAAASPGAGTGAIAVAVGDFNADGKADLAVANNGGGNVSVLLGAGDGTFAAAVNYTVGTNPRNLAVGDFNADGKADIVVANLNSSNVGVLMGVGNGTFAAAINYGAGTNPRSIASGDFNADGKTDLAVAGSTGNVGVMLGNGDGSFGALSSNTVGTSPQAVTVGDFNADGNADLAVANYNTSDVSVLLGNGNGTFQAAVNYSAQLLPISVALGDFNGDGKTDIVASNQDSASVSVLLGNGTGTFQGAVNYAVGTSPFSVAVGDFNGNGVSDLAVANRDTNNVSILLGTTIPDLTITKSHSGNFFQGQIGATYTITVRNSGSAATSGLVTFADTLPGDLTATAMSGSGWVCVVLTCTRSDALAPQSSYPPITLTVNVSASAAASFSNTATVSGGGEINTANDTASDSTTVSSFSCTTTFVPPSGAWDNAANWSTAVLPSLLDNACLGASTVTLSTGTHSINSFSSSGTLAISAGSLSIAANSFSTGTFNLSGGTLTGAGALTVSGAFNWSGGIMSGAGSTTVASGTTFSITGATRTLDTRTLNNAGSATMTSANRIFLQNGAVFNNQAGAVYDIRVVDISVNNPILTCSIGCGAAAINNAGTFRKSLQAGLASMTLINFTNTGAVDVQIGTLTIGGPGPITDTGTFAIAAGSTLGFTAGTHTLTAAATVNGTGTFSVAGTGTTVNYDPATLTQTLQISSGTLNVNNAVSLSTVNAFGGTLTLPNTTTISTLLLAGGTLTGAGAVTVNGSFTWSAGTMSGSGATTVPSGTTFTIDGTQTKFLDTRTLNNAASATATTGSINLNNNAIFNNQIGAVFDNAQNFSCNTGCTAPAFNNAGTFRGSGTINSINFTNTGTVDLPSGNLTIGGPGSVTHTGSFALASGTTLAFNGATHTFAAAATVTGTGTISVISGTVNYNTAATLTQPLVVGSPGTLNVNTTVSTPSIQMGGSLLNLANTSNVTSLTLDFGTLTGAGALTVSGTFNWIEGTMSGSGSTTVASGATFTISTANTKILDTRTLNNAANATVTATGSILLRNGATFNNQAGAVFDIRSSQNFTCNVSCTVQSINNAGTFLKSTTAGTSTITSINFTNTGTVALQIGTLNANSYTQTAGLTVLNGGNLTVTTLNLNGGLLSGTGTITGNVTNAGIVGPGLSPGTLTITGNYTQTPTGTLLIELGGTAPGTFDRVVAASATLAGTLSIASFGGFVAAAPDTFTIITATRTGTFTTVTGLAATVTYNPTDVVLSSVAAGGSPTTTLLVPTPNPSTFGSPVTLTATVSSATATGTVTFFDGVNVLGVGTLSTGVATLTTRLLPSGVRSLKAFYAGDASFLASTSSTVSQTVTALTQNGFQARVNYATGAFAIWEAQGDFNEDGIADLVVANNGGTISVLLGNGNGTFQAALNSAGAAYTFSVSVADFNRDGKADIVVPDQSSNNVSVRLGNGNGTFQAGVTYPAAGATVAAVGDFNADGKADLAVSNNSGAGVNVLLGNGDGTFQAAVPYSVGIQPVGVVLGDFNADGKTDLAVGSTAADVNVLLGIGNGTFQAAIAYPVGSGPIAVAAEDFNGDGRTDIVAANELSNNVSVLLANVGGTFPAAVNYAVGSNPYGVTVGDINGDGKADIVAANRSSNDVSVLRGNGDGTFLAAVNTTVGNSPRAAVVGDFNADGAADLAVANNSDGNVSVLLGIAVVADMTIAKTHTGNFTQGQSGATYTITVSNVGAGATTGTVTVVDTLPASLTATAIAGTGWSCTLGTLTCTRSDALAASASYPAITLTVNVATNAPNSANNTATVSGGGETNTANNTATDPTTVNTVTGYFVGDAAPDLTDLNADLALTALGEYGDRLIDNLDLIHALRAVTNIPGFLPGSCTDRFDTMDSFPVDGITSRGGDGVLNNFDLIQTLRRITGLDTTRPSRTVGIPRCLIASAEPLRRRPVDRSLLVFGASRNGRRAVYLASSRSLVALSFALRIGNGRFVPAPDLRPSLLDTGVRGVVAAAWLQGLPAGREGRLLLGWIEGGGEVEIYGLEATATSLPQRDLR